MTPEEQQQAMQESMAPVIHQYRMGIETLIFAYLAETGYGLRDFEIKTKTTKTAKGDVMSTWIEPKVRI